METVIVVCLAIVILLLIHEKIVINKSSRQQELKQKKVNQNLPDIMGQPKPVRSRSGPKNAKKRQILKTGINHDNLDIEYYENGNADIQIPQNRFKDAVINAPDLEQEEEEWNSYGIYGTDDGFAQGVTFEELSSVGMMLQKDKLEPSQQETAIALVQKIQGTELFSLLENSIESASRKIAELLDGSLSSEKQYVPFDLRKDDLNDFNIGDFV
ncbi:conjugal transfer protein TraD [Flavobacterium procerum]|uniref:Conjugal transfer protein TraD n=1 Tax=Flavobacterium procerum TaxID=1455569 RepID=A0ABV6BS24_9FLAO